MSDTNITGDYVQGDKIGGHKYEAQTINIYHHYHAGEVADPPTAEQLAAAHATLSHIPTATLSLPDNLPYGSFMEYGRNPNFVGRAETMQGLAEQFKVGQIRVAAVTGYGGLGKSTLAVEFAHRYGRYFAGGVQWVSMADPSTIPTNIARTGGSHLHPQWHKMTLPDQVALVRRSWESPLPRLLIFDNCEAADLLEQYRPKTTGGARVLVTSRKGNWPASVPQFPLMELTVAESTRLLRGLAPYLDETGAEQVAQALGRFPLALHMAGSYLAFLHRNGRPLAPADYVAQLAAQPLAHRSLQELVPGAEPLSAAHVAHVGQTFAMSREQLAMSDDGVWAWRLLGLIAQFAPSVSLPLGVLWEVVVGLEVDEVAWAMWLELLVGVGLIEREGQAVRLHPLLGHFVGEEMAAEDWAVMEGMVTLSVSNQVHQILDAGYPAPLRLWVGHVRHVAEQAEVRGSEGAGFVWNNLGYYYNIEADYAGARSAYERALGIWEASLGNNHPQVATAVNNLGTVLLHGLGDLAGARAAYERALTISEASLGNNHPQVVTVVNNLGSVLHELGDLAGARAAYERVLTIAEASLGNNHPQIAIAINNLGSVLKDLGDLAGARSAIERALEIDEATFGRHHPSVAIRLNNLGSVLQDLGDLAGAQSAIERALAINEATFGRHHPSVALQLNNLGGVLKDVGDMAGARAAFERALAILETSLGNNHPQVATTISNLGWVLKDVGDLAGAHSALERVLAISKESLGNNHPRVASAINNLGGLRKDLGDLAGARSAFERALAILEQFFPDHPDIRIVRRNLDSLGK